MKMSPSWLFAPGVTTVMGGGAVGVVPTAAPAGAARASAASSMVLATAAA